MLRRKVGAAPLLDRDCSAAELLVGSLSREGCGVASALRQNLQFGRAAACSGLLRAGDGLPGPARPRGQALHMCDGHQPPQTE